MNDECFTMVGARAALAAAEATATPEQGRAAAEAITLHVNPIVSDELGVSKRSCWPPVPPWTWSVAATGR